MSSTRKLEFPNAEGQQLAARLELPAGSIRGYAVFAHCFTCSMDIAASTRVSRGLAAHGFAVLRFDFTGLGNSEGDFANTNFSSNVDDLVAAADYLRAEYSAPTLLVGHSLGGAAVLMAAERLPEVTAVATIGAPSQPGHLRRVVEAQAPDLERLGEATLELGGRTFGVKRQLLDDIDRWDLAARLPQLGKALLIMHSPQDEVVGIEHARRLFEAARHPKSFVSLDGMDHLVGRKPDSEYVAGLLAAWASRYLPEPDESAELAADDGRVHVTGRAGSLTQEIHVGRHTLVADEPVSGGGRDEGPTPYGFLQSALGACTSMTLHMYAKHKGWPLEQVDVRLRHDRVPAEECEGCRTQEGLVDRIERDIVLTGPLDDEQRARLMEIADRCPVHKTLSGEILMPRVTRT